jgi:nucleoside-diphosphate-sugar epimerase
MRKRVLVTGGAGFLGSHLCERLLKENCDVLCIDNYFTGARANIESLLGNAAFELMRHDITFPLYVDFGRDVQRRRGEIAVQPELAQVAEADRKELLDAIQVATLCLM